MKKNGFIEKRLAKMIQPIVSEQMLVACIMLAKYSFDDSQDNFSFEKHMLNNCDETFFKDFINEYKLILETVNKGSNDIYVCFANNFYNVLSDDKGVES